MTNLIVSFRQQLLLHHPALHSQTTLVPDRTVAVIYHEHYLYWLPWTKPPSTSDTNFMANYCRSVFILSQGSVDGFWPEPSLLRCRRHYSRIWRQTSLRQEERKSPAEDGEGFIQSQITWRPTFSLLPPLPPNNLMSSAPARSLPSLYSLNTISSGLSPQRKCFSNGGYRWDQNR